ncbi:Hg(II)-responsive transcriptional regulator [Zobellella maritima]|uniref:Hg(II)-responsive transcriptional regulator n=1 Tax=Zobellella maritima TaxID=2059725 RepID=UPI001E511B87|nr:Hg(II)-responsive transcriptional regulator [Zobellella maritima]
MTIGKLARAADMNVETIRYYQRRGLVPEPDKPPGGIRRYETTVLTRLRFIRTAQWLGFSLDEIAGLLKLEDGTHCDDARKLGERQLAKVRAKIQSLQQIEKVLGELVKECCIQEGDVSCPLIFSIYDGLGTQPDGNAR